MNTSQHNLTSEFHQSMPLVHSIVISSACAISLLLTMSVFVVSVKSLKKEFHILLILSLCASESVLNVSFVLDILLNTFPSTRTDLNLCLFLNFLFAFCMTTVYSFILMLSLERYLTIKSYNFGMSQTFNTYKIVLIAIVPCFSFLTSFITFIIPFNRTITSCRPYILYGEFSYVYYYLYGIVSMSETVLITCINLRTANNIWKIFFRSKNKIGPLNQISASPGAPIIEMNCLEMVEMEQTDNQASIYTEKTTCSQSAELDAKQPDTERTSRLITGVPKSKLNLENTQPGIQESNTMDSNEFDVISIESLALVNMQETKLNDINDINIEFNNEIESQNKCGQTAKNTSIAQPTKVFLAEKSNKNLVKGQNVGKQHDEALKQRVEQPTKMFVAKNKEQNLGKPHDKEWEQRAFVTSLVLGITTVVFASPAIVTLWITALSGSHPSPETHAYTIFLCVVNSIIDPVLFAWRTPEIREHFKNIFSKHSA